MQRINCLGLQAQLTVLHTSKGKLKQLPHSRYSPETPSISSRIARPSALPFMLQFQDQMRVISGNGRPISNAGPDQTVNEGDQVTLDVRQQ